MTTTTRKSKDAPSWFTVDKEGLAKLLDRRGRHRVLAELPSNAFDEDITFCRIDVLPGPRGLTMVEIEDDSPEGFRRISDAWTLFAPSYKTANPSKRGRFNLGEKLFLSMCDQACLTTTTGTVTFGMEGRTHRPDDTRDRGSILSATVRMNKKDAEEAVKLLRAILPPDDVTYYVNGEAIDHRQPILSFDARLPTEIEGDEGWRATERITTIHLYKPTPDERPMIYELGIPVVEYDGKWHVDVGQKVPLNSDRDNVTPSYMRKLHTAVLDNAFHLVTAEETTTTWVKEAMPHARPEVVGAIVKERFGDKVVVYDPSDLQANKEAAAEGYTVIPPRAFDKATWSTIRDAQIVEPAGKITPSNSKVMQSADGIAPISRDKWTDAMEYMAMYSREVAEHLLGIKVHVRFYSAINIRHGAWYGGRVLAFNLGVLGRAWVENPDQRAVDALLIHELAHERVEDHLDHRYYHELCRLGAAFRDFDLRLGGVKAMGVPS